MVLHNKKSFYNLEAINKYIKPRDTPTVFQNLYYTSYNTNMKQLYFLHFTRLFNIAQAIICMDYYHLLHCVPIPFLMSFYTAINWN